MIAIFDWFLGMFSKDIGIDLGTCNTLVCVRGDGIVLSEPSVVAVRKGTNTVLMNGQAVGNAAKEMIGKTPGSIVAIRPLKDGVISDFDVAEAMIKYFVRKVHHRKAMFRPRVAISIPSGITEVEKRAVVNSAERAGAREVFLIEEPVAAGIGAGLPIQDPVGSMIVDVGGGTTEMAVLSLGGMVTSTSLRIAGDEMDDSIMQYMKRTYNLLIGEQTAERIKIQIGSAYPLEQEATMEVKGRDLMAQLPRKIVISSEEIREALKEPIESIIASIKETLEKTPPELSSDLYDRGITLAGGGSLLRGADKAIYKAVGIPVRIADDPMTCVAKGTGIILEHLDELKDSLESGEDVS
jgi:rod shape-determining protein MreB